MATPQPHDITLAISRDERDLIYRALSELRGREQQRGETYRRQKLTVFAEECRRDVALIEGLGGRLCRDAAAPDLHGALKELVEEIETDGGIDTSAWPLLDAAKAALAKARGEAV
jgi:hypothetical protein